PGGYTNTSQMNGNLSYYHVYTNTSEYGRYNVTINASDVLGNFNNTEKTWFVTTATFNSDFIRIYSDGNGTVANRSIMWNAANFPGLAHEETLNVLNVSNWTIPAYSLWYNTSKELVQFKMNKYRSALVENAFDGSGVKQSAGGGWHYRIGWQGISNVAVNGTANKTATVIEHEWAKKTLAEGETWQLGDGYALTAQDMDANATPRLVWFRFKNDSFYVDRVINVTYNYSESSFAGESNVPIISTYIDNIFAGSTRDMVKLGYTWFIYNVTNITAGAPFGNLTVNISSADSINLTNPNIINLTQNTTVNLMGDLYFNVTNSSALEYYPYFPSPTHVDATGTANTTLDIVASTGVQGFINITMMEDIPPDMNNSFGFTPFRKFVSIFPNMGDDFKWVKLRIFYTEDELNSSGLTESSLKIYRYNDSTYPEKWESLAAGSPAFVNSVGLNTTNTGSYSGYVEANVTHLSYYALGVPLPAPPSTPPCYTCGSPGGGGGGGGGGGASAENYSNIELKEKRDNYVFKDKVAYYKFNTTDPIMYVNITGNISAGDVTTMVEVLKNTSTLVKNTSAPGIVYKNMNIWVGTSGFATPKNMKQGVVGFRVNNSWLEEKELASGDVRLVKWNGSGWIELATFETTKGSEHIYYEAVTESFSPFAITAFRSDVPVVSVKTPVTAQGQAPEKIEVKREETSGLNGILLVTAVAMVLIVAILGAVYLREKKKI
ncbi:MAG: PGF-pre-PGF domain-containing protein, partial [Candidatus Methanoperedenaceae archaeon]|nr:PGF-pre-PGF domain-containing protein [Candidatus Methanoperedenaceae archaeon]